MPHEHLEGVLLLNRDRPAGDRAADLESIEKDIDNSEYSADGGAAPLSRDSETAGDRQFGFGPWFQSDAIDHRDCLTLWEQVFVGSIVRCSYSPGPKQTAVLDRIVRKILAVERSA